MRGRVGGGPRSKRPMIGRDRKKTLFFRNSAPNRAPPNLDSAHSKYFMARAYDRRYRESTLLRYHVPGKRSAMLPFGS